MKQKLVAAGDRIAPRTMDRLRGKRSTTPADAEAIDRLREEVRELRTEIDECRRDNLRIAELADIVEQRLADGPCR